MAKKNSMKRALIFGATSMALTASMFVGTTFAWFTDSVTSNNNVIKSGNLDVELYYQNDETDDWTKVTSGTNVFKKDTLWEPGHTEVVKLKVVNEGSLALKYQLGVNIAEEPYMNVNDEEVRLSNFIQYGIVASDEKTVYDTRTEAIQAVSSVATLLNVPYNSGTTTLLPLTTENKDNSDIVTMVVYMPTTVGNEANAKKGEEPTINLGINLVATQETYEEDSKGNDYDEDAWHEKFEVGTANDLQAALNNGVTNFVLKNDIVATETIVIPAPTVATMSTRDTNATVINLNGYTIKGTMVKPNHVINNKGTLIIEGGTISSTAANGGSAIANYGTLTVKGTNINGASIREDGSWPSYPVNNYGDMTLTGCTINGYQGGVANDANATAVINNVTIVKNYLNTSSHAFYNGGTLTINGGTYSNNGMDGSVLYNYGSGNVTINGGTFSTSAGGYGPAFRDTSTMKINGGTFNCGLLDWGGSAVISGGTFSSQPNAKFVAAGYTTAKNADNTYTVYFPQESVEDLFENATENATVEIPAGNYSFPANKIQEGMTVKCAEGTVFSGKSSLNVNGATVVGATFSNPSGTAADQTINGTFKNCVFEGQNGLRWCYAGDTAVFENCVFSGSTYGVHFDGGANNLIFKDCTFSGFNAFAGGIKNLTMEGCTFKANGKSAYNGINMWGDTEMTNCTFVFDGRAANEWIDLCEAKKTATFNGCVVTNGTNELNFVEYVSKREDSGKLFVDGVYVANSAQDATAAMRSMQNNVYMENVNEPDGVLEIAADYTGTLTLKNCKFNSIQALGNANIVIQGNVEVKATNASAISAVGKLQIKGDGTLTAIANGDHAYGIGGANVKEIVIEDVTIKSVKGGHFGEVGSDTQYYKNAPEGGAAIGSGYNGAVITLKNVTVTEAIGGSKAAAIGANYHTGVTVNIEKSTIVYAEGGVSAAAIGGSRVSNGANEADTTVNIKNSNVTAKGGVYGAGIGSGYDTHCQSVQPLCTIFIEDSTINATGGKYAAGVGTGYHMAALAGEIKNSTVNAVSGEKFYKASYIMAMDIGFGVVDPAREGQQTNSSIVYNGKAITLADGCYKVSNAAELKGATVANATVFMQDGVYVMDTSTNNVTFVGASEENTKINYTIQHSGVKQGSIWNKTNFKNLTFVNTVFTMAEGGNSTFENVTFAAGFRRGYGTAVQFAGCTFGSNTEGYALHFETDSKSTNGVIVLNNCEFEGGKVHLGGARSYAFTGCDFAAGTDFQAWGNVTLIGCTVDGVAITADNIASFFPNLNLAKVSFGA